MSFSQTNYPVVHWIDNFSSLKPILKSPFDNSEKNWFGDAAVCLAHLVWRACLTTGSPLLAGTSLISEF
jgi:hypothetical protein